MRAQHDQAFASVILLSSSLYSNTYLLFTSIQDIKATFSRRKEMLTYQPKVVTGLATLQSAVQDLSRAYIAHTNTVIGKGNGAPVELLSFNALGGDSLFNRAATPSAVAAEPVETKKRKRAPHDKNAPKRPVRVFGILITCLLNIMTKQTFLNR